MTALLHRRVLVLQTNKHLFGRNSRTALDSCLNRVFQFRYHHDSLFLLLFQERLPKNDQINSAMQCRRCLPSSQSFTAQIAQFNLSQDIGNRVVLRLLVTLAAGHRELRYKFRRYPYWPSQDVSLAPHCTFAGLAECTGVARPRPAVCAQPESTRWRLDRRLEPKRPCPASESPVIEREQLAACFAGGEMQRIGKVDSFPAVA